MKIVRWDEVVAKPRDTEVTKVEQARPSADSACAKPIIVQVWIYGALAMSVGERPVAMHFSDGFSPSDVLAELSRRYGATFANQVMEPDGGKSRHCRMFVDGWAVEESEAPIHVRNPSTVVEIILLNSIEGG